MTTERLGAVPLADVQATQDIPPETTSEEAAWQQKVTAAEEAVANAEARAKKAENDLRAQQGRRSQRQELENLVLGTNNHIRLLDRKVEALIKAYGSGDTDSLPSQLSSIQADQASLQTQTDYQQVWTDLSQELVDLVQDEEGNPILDLQEAPELEQVRRLWTAAHQKQDKDGLHRAIQEASKVVRRIERASLKQGAADNSKKIAEEAGQHDMDTGPAAGGSGMTDARWLREVYGRPDFVGTKTDHVRAKRILDALS